MSRMKLDLVLASTADAAPERAQLLESLGVDGTFTYEDGHDLFMPLTAVAATTSLDLMTNIAVAFPRSPLVLATTANDLQLLSKGRFRLGLGTQVQAHVEKGLGPPGAAPSNTCVNGSRRSRRSSTPGTTGPALTIAASTRRTR